MQTRHKAVKSLVSRLNFGCRILIILGSILCLYGCSSNQWGVISHGVFVQKGTTSSGRKHVQLVIGSGSLSKTNTSSEAAPCIGEAGSIIPPLSVRACINSRALASSLLRNLLEDESHIEHIVLPGIESSFVSQKEPNICWAASMESARKYLHLFHVHQKKIVQELESSCGKNLQDRAASAYQIFFAIQKLSESYDMGLIKPSFCSRPECLLESLTNGRPVMMLRPGSGVGHAVLLVGMDFVYDKEEGGKQLIIPRKLHILDPEGDGKLKKISCFDIASVDAFIVF